MTTLAQIKTPVASHLQIFDKKFREYLKSKVLLLDTITRYIYKRKGKQMRPLFVFLSAGACGKVTESTFVAASMIEMLHTATLVHDDVVDDSHMRRGMFSINALWKNKIAVLVGDFLLSRGMLLSLEKEEFGLLKIVSRAVKEMSEGELLQIEKARRLDIKEEIYFEIIRKKTASLIASCCASGAASAGADADATEQMRLFGEYTGIAFQIKDDLFDYESGNITGKPSGIDIRDQKMTLPLIYLLNNSSASEKRWIISTVKRHNTDSVRVKRLVEMVKEAGGLDYAREQMLEYQEKAMALISAFPSSEYTNSLKELVIFTTERKA
ncbi:MAG: polyprenyl synthetase family protein [Bacteroidales bacterium]|nr:polyprenyl synthetase family protein [Bacteroidales bacterium]